jgi:uncharacterized RDD family membrane protein YckC
MVMERTRETLTIRTPEHMGFEYVLAGLGSRATAVLWDMAIRFVAVLFLFVVVSLFHSLAPSLDPTGRLADLSGAWILALVVLAYGTVELGYFMLFEALMNGQTPGKKIQNIRVVRVNGQSIGFLESAIRNIIRAVDMLFGIYPLGLLVMFLSQRSQRIGDFAAGTVVILEQRRPVPEVQNDTQGPMTVQIPDIALHVTTVGPVEYRLLRDFLQRRSNLDPSNRGQLARTLARRFLQRWGISPRADLSYESFLEEVVAVYERNRRAL